MSCSPAFATTFFSPELNPSYTTAFLGSNYFHIPNTRHSEVLILDASIIFYWASSAKNFLFNSVPLTGVLYSEDRRNFPHGRLIVQDCLDCITSLNALQCGAVMSVVFFT